MAPDGTLLVRFLRGWMWCACACHMHAVDCSDHRLTTHDPKTQPNGIPAAIISAYLNERGIIVARTMDFMVRFFLLGDLLIIQDNTPIHHTPNKHVHPTAFRSSSSSPSA